MRVVRKLVADSYHISSYGSDLKNLIDKPVKCLIYYILPYLWGFRPSLLTCIFIRFRASRCSDILYGRNLLRHLKGLLKHKLEP